MVDTTGRDDPYDNDQDRLDRADEQIREQRWAEFVAEMRNAISNSDLSEVLRDVVNLLILDDVSSSDGIDEELVADGEVVIKNFAQTEGWDGVLCAIARAYREEQDKK